MHCLTNCCDYLRVFGTKRNSFPPRRNGRAYRHSSVSPFENSNFEASKASGAWVERMNMTIAPTVLISRKSILNQIPPRRLSSVVPPSCSQFPSLRIFEHGRPKEQGGFAQMGARTGFKLQGKSRRIELAQCNPVHLAPTRCHVLSPSGWGSLVWNKETVTGTWIACANRLLAWRTSSKKPPRN